MFHNAIRSHFDCDGQFQETLAGLDDGIYIFGHSHIQWSYQSEDGKKILMNPGSCGLPLDCIKNTVPYSILDLSDQQKTKIEERRVPFQTEEYIASVRQSEQYKKAKVWSQIVIKELETAREHISLFLKYVEQYATKIGDSKRPFSVSTWERAYTLWEQTL